MPWMLLMLPLLTHLWCWRRPDGKLRYANNSNYKGDNMIRKEVFVNAAMLEQVLRVPRVPSQTSPLVSHAQCEVRHLRVSTYDALTVPCSTIKVVGAMRHWRIA